MAIRVLHVAPKMLSGGGIENTIMNYYRNIDKDEVQFDFLVHSHDETDFDREIKALGGNIYRVTHYHKNLFLNIFETMKVLINHKELKTVHIHTSSGIKIIDGLVARLCRKNVIFHSHSIFPTKSLKYKIITPIFRLIGNQFLGCSNKAGQYFFGENIIRKNNFKVLKNAININKYIFNQSVRDSIRAEFNIGSKFVIGHVGRFTSEKNHETILHIFNEVIKKEKDSILMLVGEGTLLDSIKKRAYDLGISRSVIFTGVRSDVNKLLQAMDTFVFPSQYEGLGMALIEAQVSGLFCVASNSILKETNITGNVEFLKVDDASKLWADRIIASNQNNKRENQEIAIRDAGYDINVESKKLQIYYKELEYK